MRPIAIAPTNPPTVGAKPSSPSGTRLALSAQEVAEHIPVQPRRGNQVIAIDWAYVRPVTGDLHQVDGPPSELLVTG